MLNNIGFFNNKIKEIIVFVVLQIMKLVLRISAHLLIKTNLGNNEQLLKFPIKKDKILSARLYLEDYE